MGMTPKEVMEFANKHNVKFIDLKFLDFPGIWQHYTKPLAECDEGMFENGFGFDGSSIRGWAEIHASDMLVVPDASAAKIDPFIKEKTLSLICDISDPITHGPYSRDPRNIAKKDAANL